MSKIIIGGTCTKCGEQNVFCKCAKGKSKPLTEIEKLRKENEELKKEIQSMHEDNAGIDI